MDAKISLNYGMMIYPYFDQMWRIGRRIRFRYPLQKLIHELSIDSFRGTQSDNLNPSHSIHSGNICSPYYQNRATMDFIVKSSVYIRTVFDDLRHNVKCDTICSNSTSNRNVAFDAQVLTTSDCIPPRNSERA